MEYSMNFSVKNLGAILKAAGTDYKSVIGLLQRIVIDPLINNGRII